MQLQRAMGALSQAQTYMLMNVVNPDDQLSV
jgi:hypothetical protein